MPEVADRIAHIRARRERLIAAAAVQRESLARDVAVWAPVGRAADRVWNGVEWVRAHPQVLLVAAGVMLVLRPRRTLRWTLRAFSVWQAYRRLTARLPAARG